MSVECRLLVTLGCFVVEMLSRVPQICKHLPFTTRLDVRQNKAKASAVALPAESDRRLHLSLVCRTYRALDWIAGLRRAFVSPLIVARGLPSDLCSIPVMRNRFRYHWTFLKLIPIPVTKKPSGIDSDSDSGRNENN